ncbi:MAG: hypothetical protein ACPGU7_00945 [Gammaproteobacteria bacterium]
MAGSILQLEESKLTGMKQDGERITLEFRPAIIVKSEGMPGVDQSTVWAVDTDLIFVDEAEWHDDSPPPLPMQVNGGSIEVNGLTYLDTLPMPLDLPGHIELELSAETGTFVVRGGHFTINPMWPGKYLCHRG